MYRNRFFYLALSAFISCAFVSCIDEKYDLNDVDLTLGTSSNLTLPTSSTGEIVLKNIMNLEEDGIVQVIDENFHIVKNGSADIPEIKIEEVKIKSPDFNKITCDVLLNKDDFNGPYGQKGKSMAPEKSNEEEYIEIGGMKIPNRKYKYKIDDSNKPSTELKTASDPITSDVVALKEVKFKDETTLEIDIMTKLATNGEFFKLVHLDDLFITYPKGLHIKDVQCTHWSIYDNKEKDGEHYGKEYLHEHKAVSIDNENGKIDLTDGGNVEIGEEQPGIYRYVRVEIKLEKASFGENDDLQFNDENKIVLQGAFQVGGTFRVETADLQLLEEIYRDDPAEKNAIIARLVEKFMSGGIDAIVPDKISFVGEVKFKEDYIEVAGAKVKVQRKVNDINPIELNDLPDFLNDPEVVLDLANPVIYVDINNPLPAAAQTEISLESQYVESENQVCKTGQITIPANQRTVYCLCMPGRFNEITHPTFNENDGNAPVAEIKPVEIENLNMLLREIPEKIGIAVSPITMDVEDKFLPIPLEEKVTVDYRIFTPLEFGEDFKLVYQGTEENLEGDLQDVNKLDTKELRIKAVATTNLPLSLTLSVDALDRNGNNLTGKIVSVDDININAHEGNSPQTEQPVTLVIKPMAGHSIGELLKQLSKFRYRAVAKAKAGDSGKLKEDAFIKLSQIQITLVGGVAYDAN